MPAKSQSLHAVRQGAETIGFNSDINLLKKYVPTKFSTEDLAREFASPHDIEKTEHLRALRACLENSNPESHDDNESRAQIRRFAARAMAPIVDEDDDDDEDGDKLEDEDHRNQVVHRCQTVARDSIAILKFLGDKGGPLSPGDDDDVQVVFTLVAAADTDQPWTTKEVAASAQQLLDHLAPPPISTEWIVEATLKGYLRRLFARGRPATITSSGRAAAFGNASDEGTLLHAESRQKKPWKYIDLRAISVFAWTLDQADDKLLGQHWPLFTPVLLALIDDPDTAIRVRGLQLLGTFISKLPDGGRLLNTTGLDRVLADTIFPTLLFLPRLTPEKESLQLLSPAYSALLDLARVAAASDGKANNTPPSIPPKTAAALLDRILRDGIYAGYFHASDCTHIVEVLMLNTEAVVTAMGLYAVKHLKDLLPMYGAVLTDPFAMQYMPTVVATLGALRATVSSCWPRLANTSWQEEITKMLMLCWLNMLEDTGRSDGGQDGKTSARDGLLQTADMLLAVMHAAGVDVTARIGPLIAKEPRLEGLFRVDSQAGWVSREVADRQTEET